MGPVLALLLALQAPPTEPMVTKGTLHLKTRLADLQKDPDFGLWILLSLGVKEKDPALRGVMEAALIRAPETTRSAALQAMALGILDPVRYQARIAHCAQLLIDNQCDDGRWDAGKPVDPPDLPPQPKGMAPRKVVLRRWRAGAKSGDDVNSRWAAWGLLACDKAGMRLPIETFAKAVLSWKEGEHDPADVVTGLSIHQRLIGKDWTKDRDILKAIDRLAIRDAKTDPASLFVLKQGLIHAGQATLGGRDWWQDGVKVLAAAQAPDGSWVSFEDTCYATLFLRVPQ